MRKNALGYLTLVLHAHLPFVRDPRHDRFLEENWLFEALTETYLPLLMMFDGLIRDRVDFRLAMTLTPTLVSMLDDELLRERFERRLGELIELSEKETQRLGSEPELYELASFYHDRLRAQGAFYRDRCQRDVTGAFRRLQDSGRVEILTSAATHGFLPILRHEPAAVRGQIAVAVDHYCDRFGRQPEGIWLPECGYYPGLDETLRDVGIRYFFVESHALLHGSSRPKYGVYSPTVCESGVATFARDPECAKQVWSVKEGFPGAPDYREFYRDIGFDLPLDYVGPYIAPDSVRIQTGLKYYRVTGDTDAKEPYVRARALRQVEEHAELFCRWRCEQMEWLAGQMDRRPVIVAPYDAELFGHWWFEGPEWLDALLRRVAQTGEKLMTATPSEYLAEYPEAQVVTPEASSWGAGGYSEVWINPDNDWIVPRVLRASRELAQLSFVHTGAQGRVRRVLNQASRELLLAQSSDWAFIIRNRTAAEYAAQRVNEHLENFETLIEPIGSVGSGELFDESRFAAIEARNNLFPDIDFEHFAEQRERPSYAVSSRPLHIAFLAAEAAPFVKVGGLGDVAAALPPALAEWGRRVTVVLPGYRAIDRDKHKVKPLAGGLRVPVGGRDVEFELLEAASPAEGVRVILVGQDEYFSRDGVYVDPISGEEYPDSAERFVFFTRAALEALRELGHRVDVVHSHDHQTALASAYVKFHYRDDPVVGLAACVYTLHNLGYQGDYDASALELAGFGLDQFYPGSDFEHHGRVNFMKLGIQFADKVNTVSENYAREIRTDESLGAGLRSVLEARGEDFQGILNGIDVDTWDPAKDPFLPHSYSADVLDGKQACKIELMDASGLDRPNGGVPLVGMVTRLVDQKGLDLVEEALPQMLELGIQLVVLGTGIPRYEEYLRQVAEQNAGVVAALIKFDNRLAHLIEAGSDMFLMPSLYEPCGLNQMYSLRYGSVPVVRATGGLADTVIDSDAHPARGVGFTFSPYTAAAMVDALARAVRAYHEAERWREIQRRGMTRDYSWGVSALKYVDLYADALRTRT